MAATRGTSILSGPVSDADIAAIAATPGRPGPRSLSVWVLVVAFLANLGAILWLWLHGGGVGAVHSTGDLLTSLGRVTGLVGAYLALVQILLLARMPWLERWIGFDRLTVWHRRNGKLCLTLIVAHAILITIGYALTDKISIGHEISTLLGSYPEMVTATIGTGVLIAIVISSLIAVRRRLPYEGWYALHLATYGAIALGYLHQIPTGNEFSANTSQADYWIALYVATLALLLVFRLGAPALRAFRHRLRVVAVHCEAPGLTTIEIGGRRLERLGAQAGQFFIWRFLTGGRWWQAHPFSLSRAPGDGPLRITVKAVGGFSAGVAAIRPGTRVIAEGPFGTFTAALRSRQRIALIAGGIGITPLRALFEQLPAAPGDLDLIYRVLAEDDLVLREELERIAAARGARLHLVVGDHRDEANADLLAPEHLQALIPDIDQRDVYLCGPVRMMDVVRANLKRAGVPRRQIHSERFALAM